MAEEIKRLAPKESTIKKLFGLSGNQCTFPGCTEKMITEEGDILGEICHIEAAKEGGERFNQIMNNEQRRNFKNLILLCPTHHKVTDNEEKYTAEILKKMKNDHIKINKTSDFEIDDNVVGKILKQYHQTYNFSAHTQENNIYNGLSYIDTKTVFLDLLRYEIKSPDGLINKREQEFKNSILKNLDEKDKEKFKNPDILYISGIAMKNAIRADEPVLRNILSKLLIQRIKTDNIDLKKSFYNQAIQVAGDLTENQLKILAISFLLTEAKHTGIETWKDLNDYIDTTLQPFISFEITRADIESLKNSNCIEPLEISENNIEESFRKHYPFLFSNPIPEEVIQNLPNKRLDMFFIKTKNEGKTSYLLEPRNDLDTLEQKLIEHLGISTEESRRFTEYYKKTLKNNDQIKKDLIAHTDIGKNIVQILQNARFRKMKLTLVGNIIASTYIENILDLEINLDNYFK